MSNPTNDTRDWPGLAIGLFDALTGRQAEIQYAFEDFNVTVPSKAGDGAEFAKWKIDGNLRIRTSSQVGV